MRRSLLPLLLSLLPLLACGYAYAALGGAPSHFGATSPRLTARSLAAAAAATPAAWTVSTSTLDSGTVVREYVNPAGAVFAVSWNGPFLPDLRALLGQHFGTMTGAAAQRPKAGHSQLAVERPDVVIVSNGHMRAFSGRAWIPGELPAGFSPDNIE
ncbi:DUF2844 domain-containing protein [Rugamonas apoptosis]|uniref:DUF2844 domain-containing protein n=1 Tax=Rugamonas apoptosis TaxID=2758570 RepID=A0A7W2F717_9BURK|nr:DUF2844 domain-containing protein [Rugamonas apoptosis]MBA5686350.1 DUF2844 domain-containing protein [Rugamonas apoptosis]